MPYVLKCHTTNEPTLKEENNDYNNGKDSKKAEADAEEDRRLVLFIVNLVLACGMVGFFFYIATRINKAS